VAEGYGISFWKRAESAFGDPIARDR